MRTLRRILTVLVALVIILALVVVGGSFVLTRQPFPQISGTVQAPGLKAPVTIIRDTWGVPHIYAQTVEDLFFAQGYVHAQDRFWQMEFWRRIGQGRLSEVLGSATLETDKFLRTLGMHRTAAKELELLNEEERTILNAYASGVNAYLTSHAGQLGLEFTLLNSPLVGADFTPEPWTPLNSLTWLKLMAWDLGGNMDTELLRVRLAEKLGPEAVNELLPPYPADRPVIVPGGVGLQGRLMTDDGPVNWRDVDTSPLDAIAQLRALLGAGGLSLRASDVGSNNWVVAGSRTASGKPLLANDPHLGIQMPSIWYEVGLHGGGFDVVGFSFAGVPGVILGHNARIAWGFTNAGPDVQDLYIEKINPDNPNQYEYQGQWEDFQIVPETIRVRGRAEPVVLNVRISRHGPLLSDVDESLKQPLALRWTALEPGHVFRTLIGLNRAGNWDDFVRAGETFAAPSQNIVYADVDGNIGYLLPGQIPIRAKGDGLMPVPGWTGEYEWSGAIPYDQLPRVFNPPQGWIVTANNAITGPDYPYLIGSDYDFGYRAARIIQLLTAKDKLTVDDMAAIQLDAYALYAEEVMPYLQDLRTGDARADAALDRLRTWDLQEKRESVGATLFETIYIHLGRNLFQDELGPDLIRDYPNSGALSRTVIARLLANPAAKWWDDVTTPDQQETRDDILKRSVLDAVADLTQRLGEDMNSWTWGRLHTATFVNQSLGRSGISVIEQIFNRGPFPADGGSSIVNANGWSIETPFAVRSVPSMRAIYDLSNLSNSRAIHTTGQSGHPYHRHYDDFIPLWLNGQYHPQLWDRAEIERNAEGVLTLRP